MDISESKSIVLEKLRRFEPEYALRIFACILLQDQGEQEVINMASYPDQLIRDIAFNTKTELLSSGSVSLNSQQDLSHGSVSVISSGVPSSASFLAQSPFYNPQSVDGNTNAEFTPLGFSDCIHDLQKQISLSLENQEDSIDSRIARLLNQCDDALDALYDALEVSIRNWIASVIRIMFSNTFEFPVKTCHYYNKGYCRHGNNCRYYHGPVVPKTYSQMRGNDAINDYQEIALAQLELEIVELLKSRGSSISIASLPEAYQEKYKKVLQADGYLTESQRHGKSGYNLARLLVKFRNSIRLIDRPHGQHVVVLAEEASKYKRNMDCQNVSASQQIYLTFPADSTFSEEDVKNYFSTFGCVEDVRIPCQQRRMFGFVTFVDSETVKIILDKGNPHYVSGSRVLVKPYKEKPNHTERKQSYRVEHSVGYSPCYVDVDTELNSISRNCTNPRLMKSLFLQEKSLEFQRRFAMQQQTNQKSFFSSPPFGINMDALGGSNDHGQPAEPISYAPNNYFDEGSEQWNFNSDVAFATKLDPMQLKHLPVMHSAELDHSMIGWS